MSETIQFDPALRQLLLQKTGDVSGIFPSEAIGVEEIPVVAKLVDPSVAVEGLTVTARFGQVVTGRVALNRIVRVRQDPNIMSLKASETHEPDLAFSVPEIQASQAALRERLESESVTGCGVVFGFADWGCDFAHANFRDEHGGTRLLYLWDQRGGLQPESPEPFCYGREFSRDRINLALAQADPYVALDYDPADADVRGIGTHGTHVMDIAAGNGRAPGASPGVAPGADLIFVHLKGDDTRPSDTLGDSVRLLEAIRYIIDRAGDRPVVINMSLGRTIGPHDGKTLVEQGLDAVLAEKPGRAIVMSTGNYFDADLHSRGHIDTGEHTDLQWRVTPRNDETAKMEVWYSGADTFSVEAIDPTGKNFGRVGLGDNSVVREDERIIVSIFHRRHDPNNGDHHCVILLWADAMLGTWITRLHGESVTNGQYHAWIERDDPPFQSRFTSECAVQTNTTNTICNGFKTIAVGAYDAREALRPLVPVSSEGPTRDNRMKPDISAPGAGIRAARSSYPRNGYRETNGLTTKSGSSMAAPHVAGTVALMFEAAGKHYLSIEETRDILFKTARSSPPYTQLDHLRYGAGRVDAAAAVKEVRAMRESKAAPNVLFSPKGTQTASLTLSKIEESYGEDYVVVSDKEASDDDVELHDFDWADWDDQALQKRLAVILPRLLVKFGDSELGRNDPYGVPIYDKSQLLIFGPTGRQYSLTAGRFNYHAANFVYNTAYQLGYDVPVYPLSSDPARNGKSYNNTAATFAALAGRASGDDKIYFCRFFDVIARPNQDGPLSIRAGDLLLRGPEPGAAFGHIAIIADPILRNMIDPVFRNRDARGGKGVQCIDAGVSINTRHDRFGRVLIGENGKVLDNRLVLRFKESAIDFPRILEQTKRDESYRKMLGHAYRKVYCISSSSSLSVRDGEAESAGAGSPFLSEALAQCWTEYQRLERIASASTSPSSLNASRIQTESGVIVDSHPYFGITREKLEAVIRAAFDSHQMPETLLALWVKEGSSRMVTSARVVTQATTAQNARTLFRSQVYYEDLGIDYFIVTTRRPGGDNTWDARDSAASGHEMHFATQVSGLVSSGLLSENISSAINAELIVSTSTPYSVRPTVKFYALSLLLADALFTRMQRNTFSQVSSLSPALNYMQWNMGTETFRRFLASADRHRRESEFLSSGEPLTIESWTLHTQPKVGEWEQARINAIKYMHYIESYRPIFISSLNLIKPGIEIQVLPSNVG